MALYKTLAAAAVLAFSLSALALENYRAAYDLSVRGVDAGTVIHDAFFTDLTYRIDTTASPSVAARMLGIGKIRESVKGLLQGRQVQPQNYQRNMQGDNKYHLVYNFQPKAHQIQTDIGGEKKTLAYDADLHPLDILSMVVQSLKDIEANRVPSEYTLVLEDKVQTYQVQKLPDQTWKSRKSGSYTVHVYRQSSGGKQTIVYFAENPLRLVRLEQLRDGKKRFSLTLTDYQTLQ